MRVSRLGRRRRSPCTKQTAREPWKAASCVRHWYARDSRRRDRDNCLASLKATFDGLTDSGLLADDSGITHLPLVLPVDSKNPRVELHLTQEAA